MGLNYLPSPAIIQQFFWPIMTLIICVQTYKKFGLVAKIGVGTFVCLIYIQNVNNFADADELPLPEILLFLKLYDGYTEPIRFGFRWTVFGFYWLKAEDPGLMDKIPLFGHRKKERLLQLWVMCTLGKICDTYQ